MEEGEHIVIVGMTAAHTICSNERQTRGAPTISGKAFPTIVPFAEWKSLPREVVSAATLDSFQAWLQPYHEL